MNVKSGRLMIVLFALMAAMPQAREEQLKPLDVNDVSYLWPPPTTASDVASLVSATDKLASGAELWGKDIFDTVIETAQRVSVTDSAGFSRSIEFDPSFRDALLDRRSWKVAGFRIDPCAPGCEHTLNAQFGAAPQIRLILQPVTIAADGFVRIHDITAHLVFNFTTGASRFPFSPDRTEFLKVVQDLVNLRRIAGGAGIDTAGALTIHPALKAKLQPFIEHTNTMLRTRLSADRMFAVSFMGLATAPEPWLFFPMVKGPSGKFVLAPQPSLGNTAAQILTFRGGTHVMPAPIVTNLGGGRGVSTAVLFEGDVQARLDKAVLEGLPAPAHRDIPDFIANPNRAHFFNTDCVSCHSESTRRSVLKIQPRDASFSFARPSGTSGVDLAMLPTSIWNVRNFGWFQRGKVTSPTVSQRTANEAAESADQINRQYLNANPSAAMNGSTPPRHHP